MEGVAVLLFWQVRQFSNGHCVRVVSQFQSMGTELPIRIRARKPPESIRSIMALVAIMTLDPKSWYSHAPELEVQKDVDCANN